MLDKNHNTELVQVKYMPGYAVAFNTFETNSWLGMSLYLTWWDKKDKREKIRFEWKSKTRVTSSNLRVTTSNPRVRRLKARVAILWARVGTLKAQVGRLKARVEAIKQLVR